VSRLREMQCWEIIKCNRKKQCLSGGDQTKTCWERVKDDDACSFHICIDCLVYVAKQHNSLLSEEEFSSILAHREEKRTRRYECNQLPILLESLYPD
jgi:hypothetical protein